VIDCSMYVDEGDDSPIPFLCEGCRNGVCPRYQGASPKGGSVNEKQVLHRGDDPIAFAALVDKQVNWL